MAQDSKANAAGGEPVGTSGRYRVFGDQRLGHLDQRGAEAYRAVDSEHPEYPIFAMATDAALPVRQHVLQALMNRSAPGLLNPVVSGTARLGPERRLQNVVVLERPEGGTLAAAGRLTAQEVTSHIMPPLFDAVDALAARNITHRGIRPDNIYFLGKERQSPVLGPCVCGLPGAAQPAIYEPVERASAMPEARGEGSIIVDLYALGVTIVGLLTGQDPTAIEDSVRLRLMHGSYATLVGRYRFSAAIDVLLQGLLNDDVGLRWGIEQLRRWRVGTWDRARPWVGDRQAPRPFIFMGKEYRQPRVLALDFAANIREAATVAREGGFEIWLRHSLGDNASADRIRDAVGRDAQSDPGYQDSEAELVARICGILDPLGPVRFRELSVMRDGIGPLMAATMASGDREKIRVVGTLLGSSILSEQIGFIPSEPLGLPAPIAASIKTWVREPALGCGLERCLYELNQTLPCLSPLVEGAAETLNDLPRALDHAATTSETPRSLLDRHVAGFLAARSKHFERRLVEIGRSEKNPLKQALTMVHLFAEMQRYHRPEPLHALCAWAASTLLPVVKAIHGTTMRERLIDEMPGLAVKGDLAHLLNRMKLAECTARDEENFKRAKMLHQHLGAQIAAIDGGTRLRAAKANEWGQWLATVIAFIMLVAGLGSVFGRFFA